jgi:hypothetical protein
VAKFPATVFPETTIGPAYSTTSASVDAVTGALTLQSGGAVATTARLFHREVTFDMNVAERKCVPEALYWGPAAGAGALALVFTGIAVAAYKST